MKTEIVKLDPKEFGLEKSKATEITKGLSNILKEKEILSQQYAKVIKLETTKANVSIFRELRLQIRDNRTKGIEAWHKTNKEYFLRGGQFVDAIKRKESDENARMEEQLLKGEKHFEILEAERKEKLKDEREKALAQFEVETEHLQLGEMPDDVWSKYFNGVKLDYKQRIAAERKDAAAEKAKKEAEAKKVERINSVSAIGMFWNEENQEYYKEGLTISKKEILTLNANDFQQKLSDIAVDLSKKKKIAEAEAKKNAEIQAKKDAKTNRIAKELQDKKDKEAKAKKDAEAKKRLPDKKKLIELAERFAAPKLPEVKSNEAKIILKEVAELCNEISIFITRNLTNL